MPSLTTRAPIRLQRFAAHALGLPSLEALALRRLTPFVLSVPTCVALAAMVMEAGEEAVLANAGQWNA
jgi:hypothetical protein